MEFRDYRVNEEDKKIVVENVRDFNLVHTFECGQCFRWIKQADESFTGVAGGRVVNIRYKGNRLEIANATLEDFKNFWFDYLDMGMDYSQIKAKLAKKDPIMKEAVEYGWGMRLLKQDLWETLISFIISTNRNIPMIMKSVSLLAGIYGERLHFNGQEYFAFPGVDEIAGSSIEELGVCKSGFRCKYIYHTARMLINKEVDLSRLTKMNTQEARKELMRFPGVGPKVADCILLFSGTKHDVFPTDVWVKRVMEELYFKRKAGFKEIYDFSNEYFGDMAGLAQQYLFYYARGKKIGAKK